MCSCAKGTPGKRSAIPSVSCNRIASEKSLNDLINKEGYLMSEAPPYVPKVVKQYVGDIDFDTEGYVDWYFH